MLPTIEECKSMCLTIAPYRHELSPQQRRALRQFVKMTRRNKQLSMTQINLLLSMDHKIQMGKRKAICLPMETQHIRMVTQRQRARLEINGVMLDHYVSKKEAMILVTYIAEHYDDICKALTRSAPIESDIPSRYSPLETARLEGKIILQGIPIYDVERFVGRPIAQWNSVDNVRAQAYLDCTLTDREGH
jgi:hypothetical protein